MIYFGTPDFGAVMEAYHHTGVGGVLGGHIGGAGYYNVSSIIYFGYVVTKLRSSLGGSKDEDALLATCNTAFATQCMKTMSECSVY